MTDNEMVDKTNVRIWVLFLLLGGAVLLCAAYGLLVIRFIPASERSTFGDMFGGINALLSAFAFAGLIYTVLLQREELALQRDEIRESRGEMQRSIEAQNLAAHLQALSTLISIYNEQLTWMEEQKGVDRSAMMAIVSRKLASLMSELEGLAGNEFIKQHPFAGESGTE